MFRLQRKWFAYLGSPLSHCIQDRYCQEDNVIKNDRVDNILLIQFERGYDGRLQNL